MLPITALTPDAQLMCPIRSVLSVVFGRWRPLIILALEDGPMRFSAIKRTIGDVTQRVLTESLRALERDGHLTRHVKAGPPIEVSYALTDRGRALLERLRPLVLWAGEEMDAVKTARRAFDERQ